MATELFRHAAIDGAWGSTARQLLTSDPDLVLVAEVGERESKISSLAPLARLDLRAERLADVPVAVTAESPVVVKVDDEDDARSVRPHPRAIERGVPQIGTPPAHGLAEPSLRVALFIPVIGSGTVAVPTSVIASRAVLRIGAAPDDAVLQLSPGSVLRTVVEVVWVLVDLESPVRSASFRVEELGQVAPCLWGRELVTVWNVGFLEEIRNV